LPGTFRSALGVVPDVRGGTDMNLPKLDISTLPDLDVLTGVFGTISPLARQSDSIIILGTYIYETIPPHG
jgi:hypothetical protein